MAGRLGYLLGAWAFDVHAVAAGVVELREADKAADLHGKERICALMDDASAMRFCRDAGMRVRYLLDAPAGHDRRGEVLGDAAHRLPHLRARAGDDDKTLSAREDRPGRAPLTPS